MSMQGYKAPEKSLTIQAGSVGALFSILGAFGVHISPEVLPQFEAIVTGLAAAIAIYGRIRAKTLIY